ncbi:MAG: hypothetical protein ACKOWF_01660, partial [Chloroflexota bacterium]
GGWVAYADRGEGKPDGSSIAFSLSVPTGKVYHLRKGRPVSLAKVRGNDKSPRHMGRVTLAQPGATAAVAGPGAETATARSRDITRVCDAAVAKFGESSLDVSCPGGWTTILVAAPAPAPAPAARMESPGVEACPDSYGACNWSFNRCALLGGTPTGCTAGCTCCCDISLVWLAAHVDSYVNPGWVTDPLE